MQAVATQLRLNKHDAILKASAGQWSPKQSLRNSTADDLHTRIAISCMHMASSAAAEVGPGCFGAICLGHHLTLNDYIPAPIPISISKVQATFEQTWDSRSNTSILKEAFEHEKARDAARVHVGHVTGKLRAFAKPRPEVGSAPGSHRAPYPYRPLRRRRARRRGRKPGRSPEATSGAGSPSGTVGRGAAARHGISFGILFRLTLPPIATARKISLDAVHDRLVPQILCPCVDPCG